MVEQGKIRVGKIRYINGEQIIPKYEDYENVICMTKSSEYGAISPYCLKDDNGNLIENVWQFSKLYNRIADSQQKYSRYDSRIIWRWPSDIFVQDEQILPDYWLWRKKGMESPDPIRYPVGFNNRSSCIGAIKGYDVYNEPKDLNDFEILDYIESRKLIYWPLYSNAVKKHRKYKILQDKLNQGINLLICEIDCSYQDSIDYYKETYGVDDDFIENWSMEVNKKNMEIVLNDTKHPFGHANCLGMALLGISID